MELDLKKHKNFTPIIVIIGAIFCNFGVLPALFWHSDTQKSRILCGFLSCELGCIGGINTIPHNILSFLALQVK